MQTYKRTTLEQHMSPMDTQNFLQQVVNRALSEGCKVVRRVSSVTDHALRTRRTIEEVRVCAGGQI